MATVVLDDVVRTKAQDEQAQPAPRLVPSISLAPPHAGPLAEVVAATGTSVVLRPCAFFVAWSGVLTLAYTGFPEAMRVLKQGINNSLTALSKEAPGEETEYARADSPAVSARAPQTVCARAVRGSAYHRTQGTPA